MNSSKKRNYLKTYVSKTIYNRKKSFSLSTLFSRKFVIGVIALGCIGICIISIAVFLSIQLRPAKETNRHNQKKIPRDVAIILKAMPTASPSANFRIPILMYHYVEYVKDKKDKLRVALNISPDTFEAQIKTLKDAGYTFITMADVAKMLDGKEQLPLKPIVITIDDGHWDLDTDILPILEKYHVKATAYIISGFIGGSDFLTKKQLQHVIDSGLVEIGDHTVHHIQLAGKFDQLVRFEVAQSKSDLEKEYNLHIISFAYPSGSFDEQAITQTKAAGYATAVSTIPGIVQNQLNRFFLYRIRPGYRVGDALLTYLQQNTFKPW